MPTTIPKRHLVKLIIDCVPADEIHQHFGISEATDLEQRLTAFRKSELERLLRKTDARTQRLKELESRYPFGATGTFYLPKVQRDQYTHLLVPIVNELERAGRKLALIQNSRAIRAVYVDAPPEIIAPFGFPLCQNGCNNFAPKFRVESGGGAKDILTPIVKTTNRQK